MMERYGLLVGLVLVFGCHSTGSTARDAQETTGPVVRAELIFPLENRPTPSCHASTIVQTRDGTLVAAWFAGTAERNPDVGIWVARIEDGRWTRPVEVANGVITPEKRFPCWNPVLFQPRQGPLVLFFKVGPKPSEWWGEMIVSENNGKTWKDRRRLPANVLGPVKDKPIQLDDGRILCPSSTENGGWRARLEVTQDLDKWEVIGPLNDPNKIAAIQPTILTYPDRRLQMLCRTKSSLISQTWSQDGGRSWSEMTLTTLPNPSSGIDAVTLRDGRQLLVYNHTATARTPLNVALSRDGKDWTMALTLEDQPAKQYSYPAVIQSADGLVHIVYTYWRQSIKYVVLDPKKL